MKINYKSFFNLSLDTSHNIRGSNSDILLTTTIYNQYTYKLYTLNIITTTCFLYIQANYCILRLETTYGIINVAAIAHPVYANHNSVTPHRTKHSKRMHVRNTLFHSLHPHIPLNRIFRYRDAGFASLPNLRSLAKN